MAAVLVVTGCGTQKNTAKTRWWHAFKARYNTYYNGTLAYIDGSLEKENGNKDNFTEIIPLYTVGNKANRETGKANFDRAIEKCQKTIKLHSIKRRPVWNKKRRKTEKDIEWLSRREYNPFLWKAWMLMGRSQFHKGAFDEAASTFSYMSRLYQTQPAIYAKARAWLAKCYVEEDWMYDAEDVIRNMQRDSIHWSAQKEWDYTYADYYIHTGDYAKAVPYLRKVIKHEMRRKQRAREWFLMGQLQAALGNDALAMKAYRHVVRQNPPYELEFNARIAMTEVASKGQAKKMIGKLKRMAASDKNKEYLDQVYYAIGNIYLSQRDTANAISAYERGNAKATRSGIEKGVLLLRLGDLYWERERYNDAQRCYGAAIGMLDKDRKDYAQLSERSKVLDELVPFTDAVHLQDSLQELSRMDEKERNAAIDRVIDALKKKEKEERDKQAEQNAQETMAKNGGNNMGQNQTGANAANSNTTDKQGNGLWYFYNPLTVSQGKTAFQKLWGKRENVDNWQRVNKTVVSSIGAEELSEEQLDSISRAEAALDSIAQVTDSAQNDPHKREYYMAQIPFSDEAKAASNKIIEDGLYNSGVIFKDKLDNLALSEKQLLRLINNYPDYEKMPDAYYHLFLLYSRKGMPSVADGYVDRLKSQYPDNDWTTLLTDPYFKENAAFGVHIEDSLYACTYEAFKAARYAEVAGNVHVSTTRFPLGANRDKFVFIGGLGKLNQGDADGCLADMKTVVEKYPQSGVSAMAGMIINGVQAGRRLRGGTFDIGNIWERRTAVLNDNDTTGTKKLSAERNANFVYIIAYKPDSLDENKLLFELARYNFTSYLVRNFDISIADADGIRLMSVSGFRNYDEALQYARNVNTQPNLRRMTANNRTFIISEQNLALLGKQYSYDDYVKFYAKHFAPLKVSAAELLTEPDMITTRPERKQVQTDDDIDRVQDNNTVIDSWIDDSPADNGTTLEDDGEANKPGNAAEETVVPEPTPTPDSTPENGSTVIDETPTEAADAQTTTVADDNEAEKPLEESAGSTIISDEPQPIQRPDNTEQKPNATIVKPQQESAADATGMQKKQDDATGTPSAKSAGTPTGNHTDTDAPAPKPDAPKAKSKTLEDDFYFDDDITDDSNVGTPTTAPGKKQRDTDVTDDEYYELDGF